MLVNLLRNFALCAICVSNARDLLAATQISRSTLRDEPIKGLDKGIGLARSCAGFEAEALMVVNALIDMLLRFLSGFSRGT